MHILSDLIEYSCEISDRAQETTPNEKPMSLDEARKILNRRGANVN